LHYLVQDLDDPGGNTCLGIMGRWHLGRTDQLKGAVVDQRGVGKCTAHINANPYFHQGTLLKYIWILKICCDQGPQQICGNIELPYIHKMTVATTQMMT